MADLAGVFRTRRFSDRLPNADRRATRGERAGMPVTGSYGGDVSATIRAAIPDDVPAMSAIYGQAVRASVATFDLIDPPDSYWLDKLASTEPGDHAIVVTEAGSVVGFAYASAFRSRPAYGRTRETSIYLASTAVGRGLGDLTYAHLLALLVADGVHTAVAVVAEPNPASCALHESLGFELVGTLREVGQKFNRWIDTRWYQLMLEP